MAWLAAAREVLPGFLLYPGGQHRWSLSLTADQAHSGEHAIHGRRVDVTIPASECMAYDVEIPRAAGRRAAEILAVDLRKQAGIPTTALVSTSVVCGRTPSSLTYRQFVMHQERLKELQVVIESAGGILRTAGIADKRAAPFIDNRSRTDRPVTLWWGFGLFALLAVGAGWVWEQERRITALETTVAQVGAENTAIQAFLRRQSDATEDARVLVSQLEAAMARFRSGQGHAATLYALTDALPDGVWTSELAMSDQDGRFTGFSNRSVPAMISEVASAPQLSTLSLSGPVTTDRQRGVHRFEARWFKSPQS